MSIKTEEIFGPELKEYRTVESITLFLSLEQVCCPRACVGTTITNQLTEQSEVLVLTSNQHFVYICISVYLSDDYSHTPLPIVIKFEIKIYV